ncbi:MAG: hypothetical protein J1F28_05990 [Oscillospiraceae bacterium]|nr:hypothetical protein [Oscillospiraceae bacterium]
MKLKEILNKFKLTNLKFTSSFLEVELEFSTADRDAAWELYVELLTRCATRKLKANEGDNEEALTSLYSLFGTTREILKKYGTACKDFSKIAIAVLNQIIRPFTSKWHRLSLNIQENNMNWDGFREELELLQRKLNEYLILLAEMAGVEDFSQIIDETI